MGEFTNIYRKICDYQDHIGIVEEISNLVVELHSLEARPSSLHSLLPINHIDWTLRQIKGSFPLKTETVQLNHPPYHRRP